MYVQSWYCTYMAKNLRVEFRITAAEADLLDAARGDLSRSEYLRALIGDPIPARPPTAIEAMGQMAENLRPGPVHGGVTADLPGGVLPGCPHLKWRKFGSGVTDACTECDERRKHIPGTR